MSTRMTLEGSDQGGSYEALKTSSGKDWWRMGCLLTSPESGKASFVHDVLRFRNLSEAMMDVMKGSTIPKPKMQNIVGGL